MAQHARKRRRRAGTGAIVIGSALLAILAAYAALCLYLAGAADPRASAPTLQASDRGGMPENPIDWDYWQGVNPALIGWLYLPGTGVNHPVVAASSADPRFYLSHDMQGNWNPLGCPYLDAGCSRGLDSPHVVIVGHNISFPPCMFHDVELFHDSSFASEHRQAWLYTPRDVRHLHVAGVRTIAGWEQVKRVEFLDEADFAAYRDEMLASCDQAYDTAPDTKQLITICSCSYFLNPEDERTLVYLVED